MNNITIAYTDGVEIDKVVDFVKYYFSESYDMVLFNIESKMIYGVEEMRHQLSEIINSGKYPVIYNTKELYDKTEPLMKAESMVSSFMTYINSLRAYIFLGEFSFKSYGVSAADYVIYGNYNIFQGVGNTYDPKTAKRIGNLKAYLRDKNIEELLK